MPNRTATRARRRTRRPAVSPVDAVVIELIPDEMRPYWALYWRHENGRTSHFYNYGANWNDAAATAMLMATDLGCPIDQPDLERGHYHAN